MNWLLICGRLAGDAPDGWRTGYVLALFVVGIVLLVAFIYWQSIAKNALMPLWVWKDRNFSLVCWYHPKFTVFMSKLTKLSPPAHGNILSWFYGILRSDFLPITLPSRNQASHGTGYHRTTSPHGSQRGLGQCDLRLGVASC